SRAFEAAIQCGVAGKCYRPFHARARGTIVVNDLIATSPAVVDVFDQRGAQSARRSPPWPPAPPLPPGDINVAVAPRPTPTVIIVAVIWLVIIPSSVDDSAV